MATKPLSLPSYSHGITLELYLFLKVALASYKVWYLFIAEILSSFSPCFSAKTGMKTHLAIWIARGGLYWLSGTQIFYSLTILGQMITERKAQVMDTQQDSIQYACTVESTWRNCGPGTCTSYTVTVEDLWGRTNRGCPDRILANTHLAPHQLSLVDLQFRRGYCQ